MWPSNSANADCNSRVRRAVNPLANALRARRLGLTVRFGFFFSNLFAENFHKFLQNDTNRLAISH